MARKTQNAEEINRFKVEANGRTAYFARYSRACEWLDAESPETAVAGFVIGEPHDHPQYGKVATVIHAPSPVGV